MRESNFHQFRTGGFKRGIGNFATKQRWMHSTITGGWVLLAPRDRRMIRWWTLRHTILTFGIETKRNYALRKLRKAQFQYSDWKEANLSSMVNNKAHRFTLKESQITHLENIRKHNASTLGLKGIQLEFHTLILNKLVDTTKLTSMPKAKIQILIRPTQCKS